MIFQVPTSCAVEGAFGKVDHAVTFGDVKNSHAEIVIEEKEVNREYVDEDCIDKSIWLY